MARYVNMEHSMSKAYGERRQKSCVCIKICIVTYAVGIVAPACRISDIDPTIGYQPPVATGGFSAPCNYA
jgi:hypothetical protein